MADLERDREEPGAFMCDGGRGDSLPAEAAASASRCPDCGGHGSILLLITTRPCERCGGTGVIQAAPAESILEYTHFLLPSDPDVPGAEPPPRIFARYVYENDVPVSEERLLFEGGQWLAERYVVVDGHWQLVSRTPTAPPWG